MRPPGLTSAAARSSTRGLLLDALLERARPHAPLGVGIAPPGAGAGAGRVDQHQVGAAGEIGEHIGRRRAACAPAHCARRRVRAGHGSARGGACRCRWRRAGRGSPSPRRAPASCRRRRRRDRSPARRACAPASSAASCEPSSCTSIRPLMKAGSAWIAGLLASATSTMRRPSGDQRVGSGARSASASAASSRSP